MNDGDFERRFGSLLRQLQSASGDCPSVEKLLAGRNSRALQDHLNTCGICREAVRRADEKPVSLDAVSWKRVERSLDSRPLPWRKDEPRRAWLPPVPYLGAVAAALLLVAAGLVLWVDRPATRPVVSTVRGPTIQLVQPLGTVSRIDYFQWASPPIADRFRVTLTGPDLELQIEGEEQRLRPPADFQSRLVPGRSYRWRVEALGPSGKILATSEWADFEMGS